MARALSPDPVFTEYPVAEGDELFANGFFEFNITRLLDFIENNPDDFELRDVSVSSFPRAFSVIDESHIDSVDPFRPVLLAEIAPERYNLIDGNHRMEKARRLGMKAVPAYRLHPEQHSRFLTSRKAYDAYIEYWNGKLRQG